MRRRCVFRFHLTCLASLLAVWAAAPAAADDWPQWRGPQRDGRSAETGLQMDWQHQAPRLLWMAAGLGRGYSSVSVADGMIYTTGNLPQGQSVIAVSVDGQVQWTEPLLDETPRHGYRGARCTPSVDGDHLYVVGSHGAIYCLRRGDGQIVWQRDFARQWDGRMMSGWGFSESPLVDGDRVLCTPGGPRAMMVALDKRTGEELWSCPAPDSAGLKGNRGAGYSSMVISHGGGVKQYVQLTGHGMIGVSADGKLLWTYDRVANRTANIPTPLVEGDMVFCSTGYGTGSALLELSASGGGVRADERYFLLGGTLQNHHGGMILDQGHVYCGHGHKNGIPICVRLSTGDIAWGGDRRGAGRGSAAVAFVDGHLIFRYESGEVASIAAAPEGYQLRGVLTPEHQEGRSWAHPVVADGRLYLREQDKLMCYDLRR